MSAEMVSARRFGQSWRGYDQEEVKQFLAEVADQLRALRERAERAESARRDAEERAAHPRLDEATLMSALGEKTAEILRSAHNAAAEVMAKAEAAAERVTEDAKAKADEFTERAESLLAERTKEADEAAAQVLDQAREQASVLSEEAQRLHDELVQSAETARERILGDLARRRRLASVQIEQLRAGRERLLAAYLTVRQTLDQVTAELQRADAEARAAADAVGRQHAGELDEAGGHGDDVWASLDQSEAAPPVVLAPKVAELATETAVHGRSPLSRPSQAAAASSAGQPPVRVLQPESGEGPPSGAHPSAGEWVAPPPDDRGGLVTPADEFESVRILRPIRSESKPVPEPTTAEVPVLAVPPVTGSAPDAAPEALAQGPAEELGPGDRAPGDETDVDDLFARIRAGRAEATSRAKKTLEGANGRRGPARKAAGDNEADAPDAAGLHEVAATTDATTYAAGTTGEADEAGTLASGSSEASEAPEGADGFGQAVAGNEKAEPEGQREAEFLAERDQLTGRLEASLARKLKRALQDEQNALLDRLRGLKGPATPEKVLPSAEEHPDRFVDAGRPLLEEAARGGIQVATRVYARTRHGDEPPLSAEVVDDLAENLGRTIAEPLRQRLEEALRSGGEGTELADSLGAAYREWKTQRIEAAAHDQVGAAFSRGAYVATPEGARLTWVVGASEGPCPDCEDNTLAGAQIKGEPWPTGQLHPPAHPGCRCILVPALPEPAADTPVTSASGEDPPAAPS